MSKENAQSGPAQRPVHLRDLVELVVEPLAEQIDQARLQVLDKLQGISDSLEIFAREIVRQISKRE